MSSASDALRLRFLDGVTFGELEALPDDLNRDRMAGWRRSKWMVYIYVSSPFHRQLHDNLPARLDDVGPGKV